MTGVGANGGTVKGAAYTKVARAVEYAAFDSLPACVRDALRYADFKYAAVDCAEAIESGMTGDEVVRSIQKLDAKIGVAQ
jgi:hypothetical protein